MIPITIAIHNARSVDSPNRMRLANAEASGVSATNTSIVGAPNRVTPKTKDMEDIPKERTMPTDTAVWCVSWYTNSAGDRTNAAAHKTKQIPIPLQNETT